MTDEHDRTQFMPPRQPPSEGPTRVAPRPLEAEPALESLTHLQPLGAERQKRPISAVPAQDHPATAMATQVNSGQSASTASQSRILKGRFVIEEILGAGGMGVVYKAKDLLKVEAQDREPYVAIKVLGEAFKAHPEAFISLQRESRKTQKIAHPNIVNVHDFDRDGDTVFMTMEYLDGKPLDKLISQYRATGLLHEDALKILQDISAALIYAHGQRIIHSDFKPGNIFVTKNRAAKVLDFGIARAAAIADKVGETRNNGDDRTIFDAGTLGALTPTYASLEMLQGEVPDARDDIYALGCIAYEMFCGQHPFDRKSADEAAKLQLKPKRLAQLNRYQWRAIEMALAFKRADRVATVDEFWALFSYQKNKRGWASWLFLLAFIAAGVSAYYFWPKPPQGPDEGKVRSEIEKRLRQEISAAAIKKLLDEASFSVGWQEQLWREMKDAKQLVGETDPWWQGLRATIIQRYQPKLEQALSRDALGDAQVLLAHYQHYQTDPSDLLHWQERVAQLATRLQQAEQKRLADAQARAAAAAEQAANAPVASAPAAPKTAEPQESFKVALDTVNTQLSCASTPDMRDLDIAVGKLKTLNASAYAKEEPKIVAALVQCIKKIAEASQPRADELRKLALRIFPNQVALSGLQFAAKDACPVSLAGLGSQGARAICRDTAADGSKTPALVVVPALGEQKPFAIGKYEVTVEEFNSFCRSSGRCSPVAGAGNLPATQVAYSQAQAYADWLSKKTGKSYRLPSRAEWIHAARAGAEQADPNRNCKLNSRGIQKGDALLAATVGGANRWGLVNHLGNAREFVASGGGAAALGGSFDTPMENCNSSAASPHDGKPDGLTGFRVLREVTP
jgi:serine/threonine protein kinase